jgi:hypothetical protein
MTHDPDPVHDEAVADDDGVGQTSNGELQLSPTHGSGMAGRAGGADDEARPDRAAAQIEAAEQVGVGRSGGPSAAAEQAAATRTADLEPTVPEQTIDE